MILSKMGVNLTSPVSYELFLSNKTIALNALIGQEITLVFSGKITCIGCGKSIKKSYQDGFCFPCTQRLARCDFCVLKPDRCHFHNGTCREPEWGLSHCMIPHIVYLANSTGVKVGLTRHHQIPTRWIDQGAIQAMPLFKVPTRQVAGFVEVAVAQHISDATHWRALIQKDSEKIDLKAIANSLCDNLSESFEALKNRFGQKAIERIENPDITEIDYPILRYPSRIQTLSFSKTPEIQGELIGIKGQYLFFQEGALNIRKHQGYDVEVKSNKAS